jgi:spermidine synthase
MLEISLTRVFSVSLWYQFGFMIISTALLGFGASGTYLAVKKGALTGDLRVKLAWSAVLYSVSILIAFALMTRIPLDPLKPVTPGVANPGAATVELIGWLALYYAIIVVPFFFAGLTIGTALSAWAKEIGPVYFADLLGAGLGALGVVLALYALPGQGTVVLCSVGAALGALVFSLARLQDKNAPQPGRLRYMPWALGAYALVLLAVVLPNAATIFNLYIPPSKPLSIAYDKKNYPDMQLEYTGWTPFSRIDVMWQPGMKGQAWGLSGAYKGELPEQRFISIDAAAMTAINKWDGDKTKLDWVNALPSSLVYRLTDKPSVLLIGPGGGVDVLVAWANNARKVTAAEINPLIVDIMRNKYREFSGGLYSDIPEIDVNVAEGRNFVARSDEKYDVIQFSQVDTWAAAAAGAYSLTENYLYTTDAYSEYLNHLNDDGMLAIGRWHFEPPGQALRLVTIGSEALRRIGVTDPAQHFLVVRAGDTANMFMKKSAFTPEEIAKIRAAAEPLQFTVLYAPDMLGQAGNHFVDYFNAPDKKAFYALYPLDVSPTSDDRPFFFEYYGWTNFGTFRSGKLTLTILLIQAAILSLALILWPLWRFRKGNVSTFGTRRFIIYFAALGIGFIFVEIGLMQRFILFLGHPTFALSVVLFALLTFSGIGSYLSGKVAPPGTDTRNALRYVIPALAVVVLIYMFLLPPVFRAALGWDLLPRILLSVVFLAPLGLLMGMPFPLGMRFVAATNEPLVPWSWAVNGCASVLGSILSVMLAQSFGFTVVLGIALLVYLTGLLAILTLRTAGQPVAAASPA